MTPVDEFIVNAICPGGLIPRTTYETIALEPNTMMIMCNCVSAHI